jgi:hypothetical protein
MAFSGLLTNCSMSNLGTFTRLPSTSEYHQLLTPASPVGISMSVLSTSRSSNNSLPRVMHCGTSSNPSRVVSSADVYLASGSFDRSNSATMTPIYTEHQHQQYHDAMTKTDSPHNILNRVLSIEEQHQQGSTTVVSSSITASIIHRIPSEQQHRQRLNPVYQSPTQLTDHAAR